MIAEYFFILLMVLLTVSGQLCIKKGALAINFDKGLQFVIKSSCNIYIAAGFLMTIFAPVFYILALKKIELNQAFAFSSANYILVVFGSRYFFKEKISLMRWGGVALISSGIFLFGFAS